MTSPQGPRQYITTKEICITGHHVFLKGGAGTMSFIQLRSLLTETVGVLGIIRVRRTMTSRPGPTAYIVYQDVPTTGHHISPEGGSTS